MVKSKSIATVTPGVYKLSPNEIARLLDDEKKRRRIQRIKEVREQSKMQAARIRDAVKQKEKEFMDELLEEIKEECEIEKHEKIAQLSQLYEDSIKTIGQAHTEANVVNQKCQVWHKQRQTEQNDKVAQERHSDALRRAALERRLQEMEDTKQIRARREALEKEKERSARVAALPPPVTDDIDVDCLPRRKPVTFFDAGNFSSTHIHMVEKDYAVDKATLHDQGDAKESASLAQRQYDECNSELQRRHHGQQEAASLRGQHALYMEHLRHDYDTLMQDLGAKQRVDVNRRQMAVAKIPKQIFQPPHRRLEEKLDRQRALENAFQDVFLDLAGEDISLTLDPYDAPSDDVTESRDDKATNEDTLVDSTAHDVRDIGSPTHRAAVLKDITNDDAQKDGKPLRQLMNKINKQRDQWISQTQQVVPERDGTGLQPGRTRTAAAHDAVSGIGTEADLGADSSRRSPIKSPIRSPPAPSARGAESPPKRVVTPPPRRTMPVNADSPPVRLPAPQRATILHPLEEAAHVRQSAARQSAARQSAARQIISADKQLLSLEADRVRDDLHKVMQSADVEEDEVVNRSHQELRKHADDIAIKIRDLEAKRQEILAREALIQSRELKLRPAPAVPTDLAPEHVRRIREYQRSLTSRDHTTSANLGAIHPRPYQPRSYDNQAVESRAQITSTSREGLGIQPRMSSMETRSSIPGIQAVPSDHVDNIRGYIPIIRHDKSTSYQSSALDSVSDYKHDMGGMVASKQRPQESYSNLSLDRDGLPGYQPPPMGRLPGYQPPPMGSLPGYQPPPMGSLPGYQPPPMGSLPGYQPPPIGSLPGYQPPPIGSLPEYQARPMGSLPDYLPRPDGGFTRYSSSSIQESFSSLVPGSQSLTSDYKTTNRSSSPYQPGAQDSQLLSSFTTKPDLDDVQPRALEIKPRSQHSSPTGSQASYDPMSSINLPYSSESFESQSSLEPTRSYGLMAPLDLTVNRTRSTLLDSGPEFISPKSPADLSASPSESRVQALQSGISALLARANQQQASIKQLREELSPQKTSADEKNAPDWQQRLLEWMKPLSTTPDDVTPNESSKSSDGMELDERRLAELDSMLDESSPESDSGQRRQRPPITKKVVFRDDLTPHELSTIAELDTPASDQSTLVPSVASTPTSSPQKVIVVDDTFTAMQLKTPSRPEAEGSDSFSPRPQGIVFAPRSTDNSFGSLSASEATRSDTDRVRRAVQSSTASEDDRQKRPSAIVKDTLPSAIVKETLPSAIVKETLPSPILKSKSTGAPVTRTTLSTADFRPKSSSSSGQYSPLSQHSFSTDADRTSVAPTSTDRSDIYSRLIAELASRTFGPDAQRSYSTQGSSFRGLTTDISTSDRDIINRFRAEDLTHYSMSDSAYSKDASYRPLGDVTTWKDKLEPYRRKSPELGSSYLDQSSGVLWKDRLAPFRKSPTPETIPEISQYPLDSDSPSTIVSVSSNTDRVRRSISPESALARDTPTSYHDLTQYTISDDASLDKPSRESSVKMDHSPAYELAQYAMSSSTSPDQSVASVQSRGPARFASESLLPSDRAVLTTPELTQVAYTSESSAEKELQSVFGKKSLPKMSSDTEYDRMYSLTQNPMTSPESSAKRRTNSPEQLPIGVELSQYTISSISTSKSSSDERENLSMGHSEPLEVSPRDQSPPDVTQYPISDTATSIYLEDISQHMLSDSMGTLPLSYAGDTQMIVSVTRELTQIAFSDSPAVADSGLQSPSISVRSDVTQHPMSDSPATSDSSTKESVKIALLDSAAHSTSLGPRQGELTQHSFDVVGEELTQNPYSEPEYAGSELTQHVIAESLLQDGGHQELTQVPLSDSREQSEADEFTQVTEPTESLSEQSLAEEFEAVPSLGTDSPESEDVSELSQHHYSDSVEHGSEQMFSQRIDQSNANTNNNNNNNSTSVWLSDAGDVINPVTSRYRVQEITITSVQPVTSPDTATEEDSTDEFVHKLVGESRRLRETHLQTLSMSTERFQTLMLDDLGITDEPDLTFASLTSDVENTPYVSIDFVDDDFMEHTLEVDIIDQSETAECSRDGELTQCAEDMSDSLVSFQAHEQSLSAATPSGRWSLLSEGGVAVSGTLAEAFARRKADVMKRSEERVRVLKSKPRPASTMVGPRAPVPTATATGAAGGRNENVSAADEGRSEAASADSDTDKAQFTDPKEAEKEKYARTTRLYEGLEEVKQRRLEDARKKQYAANRERAKDYQKKLHEQAMKKSEKKK